MPTNKRLRMDKYAPIRPTDFCLDNVVSIHYATHYLMIDLMIAFPTDYNPAIYQNQERIRNDSRAQTAALCAILTTLQGQADVYKENTKAIYSLQRAFFRAFPGTSDDPKSPGASKALANVADLTKYVQPKFRRDLVRTFVTVPYDFRTFLFYFPMTYNRLQYLFAFNRPFLI